MNVNINPQQVTTKPIGLQFTETMRGFFSTTVKDNDWSAIQQGQQDVSRFEFKLTVIADDLERMLVAPDCKARMVGSVTAPVLSAQPLTVKNGEFNLFIIDPNRMDTRLMRYRMQMVAEAGKVYYLDGYKLIHQDSGFDIWSDTTILYITIYDGDSDRLPILGKGILRILPLDFLHQLTTIRVNNARNFQEQLMGIFRFARFFLEVLFEIYGRNFFRE